MAIDKVKIPVSDSFIIGQVLNPSGPANIAVVIHPATGIPQTYYFAFAKWICQQQKAVVLIYDYRGTGQSASQPLKDSRLCMSDWGVEDQAAALDWICTAAGDLPVWVIGHSLGGMFSSWHPKAGRIKRLIAIASGPAHLTRHPRSFLPKVYWFWYLGGPFFTRLFGYMPGKWVGLGADLPAGVYWQWRRWCLSPDFNRRDWGREFPAPDLGAVTATVDLIGITDDPMIPPASVKLLEEFYPAATTRYREIVPAEFGLPMIGHMAVFSRRNQVVWPFLIAV
jgi:predicted alpha/beta hydrolase